MTPATQQVATDFAGKLAREKRDGLLVRHDMGLRLAQVIEGQATYGSRAVEQLAIYLGVSVDRLYKLRTYARIYGRDQIEQWAARQMTKGGGLSFHHLIAIMVIESAAERVHWVERVFYGSLSVRALKIAILSAGCSIRKKSRNGRKPKSILGGLTHLIARSQNFIKGLASNQEVVVEQLAAAEPTKLDPLVRNKVVVAQIVLDELALAVDAAIASLATNLERIDHMAGSADQVTQPDVPTESDPHHADAA